MYILSLFCQYFLQHRFLRPDTPTVSDEKLEVLDLVENKTQALKRCGPALPEGTDNLSSIGKTISIG